MKKLFLLIFLFSTLINSDIAYGAQLKTNTETQKYVTKDELDKLLEEFEEKNGPTKQEMQQLLIEIQKDKIGLLQGNISSILALIGVIIAVITLLAGAFGVWLNDRFTKRYQEITTMKGEIEEKKKQIDNVKSEVIQKEIEIMDIVENLKMLISEQEKSLQNLKDKLEMNKDIVDYLKYVELLVEREKVIREFKELKEKVKDAITNILDYKSKGLILPEHLSDPTELDYLLNCLEKEEENFIEESNKEIDYQYFLTYILDDNDNEVENSLKNIYSDYEGYYNSLKRILELVKEK
jgi:uncharacterized membrane protein